MSFYTRNINAIKQNSTVTIQRLDYDEETGEETYLLEHIKLKLTGN